MPFGDRTGGAVCPGAAAPGTAETNRHTGTPLPGNAGFGNKSGCVSGTVSHAAMVAPLAGLRHFHGRCRVGCAVAGGR